MKDALLLDVTLPGYADPDTDFFDEDDAQSVEETGKAGPYFGTEEDAEAIMPAPLTDDGKPHEDWVRGTCPECGEPLISNMTYVGGRGYLVVWECWGAMAEQPTCTYRRVL